MFGPDANYPYNPYDPFYSQRHPTYFPKGFPFLKDIRLPPGGLQRGGYISKGILKRKPQEESCYGNSENPC